MKLCGFEVGLDQPFFLIAGPCVIESLQLQLDTAARLKEITSELGAVRDRDVMLEYLTAQRDAAPPNERPGIDRLIARIERERVAARAEMETFLHNLAERGLREETRRRFPANETGAA